MAFGAGRQDRQPGAVRRGGGSVRAQLWCQRINSEGPSSRGGGAGSRDTGRIPRPAGPWPEKPLGGRGQWCCLGRGSGCPDWPRRGPGPPGGGGQQVRRARPRPLADSPAWKHLATDPSGTLPAPLWGVLTRWPSSQEPRGPAPGVPAAARVCELITLGPHGPLGPGGRRLGSHRPEGGRRGRWSGLWGA